MPSKVGNTVHIRSHECHDLSLARKFSLIFLVRSLARLWRASRRGGRSHSSSGRRCSLNTYGWNFFRWSRCRRRSSRSTWRAGRLCAFATIFRGRSGGNILADKSLTEEEGIELSTKADVDVGCGDGPQLTGND